MPDLLFKKEQSRVKMEFSSGGSFLLYIALSLFFLVLAALGGLILLNRAQIEARDEVLQQIQVKEENLNPELIRQIFLLDQRLNNMRALLGKHIFSSNIFDLVEQNTLPQVRFLNFNLDINNNRIDMNGETVSYSELSRQIGILERHPHIDFVEFGGLSLRGNFLGFKLAIGLKPGLSRLRN